MTPEHPGRRTVKKGGGEGKSEKIEKKVGMTGIKRRKRGKR